MSSFRSTGRQSCVLFDDLANSPACFVLCVLHIWTIVSDLVPRQCNDPDAALCFLRLLTDIDIGTKDALPAALLTLASAPAEFEEQARTVFCFISLLTNCALILWVFYFVRWLDCAAVLLAARISRALQHGFRRHPCGAHGRRCCLLLYVVKISSY